VDAKADGKDVVVRLSHDEAVVLDALLHRWERDGLDESMHFEDQAEQRVLWDLTASLEPVVGGHLFTPDYEQAVQRSRAAVRDEESSG
jgi:hypothetical protein